MIRRPSVKRSSRPRIVAVVATRSDFEAAIRLVKPPDFFELRLDALGRQVPFARLIELRKIAPLLLTVRHVKEGGWSKISDHDRSAMFLELLPWSRMIDVEVRSEHSLGRVLALARRRGVRRIASVHYLARRPSTRELRAKLARARHSRADAFKLVMPTPTTRDLDRILSFFVSARDTFPIIVAGLGRYGRVVRVAGIQLGAPLIYARLRSRVADTLFTLEETRDLISAGRT